MKKKGKSKEKFVIHSSWNKNIFEKNPEKGGTPAIDKSEIRSSFVITFAAPRSLNEWVVLKLFVKI